MPFILHPSAFSLVLADLPAPSDYSSIGWVLVILVSIIGFANQGIALWHRMFPMVDPPLHKVYASKKDMDKIELGLMEYAEKYATKADVMKLEDMIKAEQVRIEHRFEQWMGQTEESREQVQKESRLWRDEITRAMGRIEGKVDGLRQRR